MRERRRVLRAVERLRLALMVAGIGVGVIVVLGGLAGKSTAWSGFSEGGGQSWTDGVKPWALWALWALLGGIVVVGLLLIGWSRGDGLWIVAGAGAFLLWHVGNEATEYRVRIESGILTMYDHHTLSFGLRVVPTAGTVGAIVVGALAALTLGMMAMRREKPSSSG